MQKEVSALQQKIKEKQIGVSHSTPTLYDSDKTEILARMGKHKHTKGLLTLLETRMHAINSAFERKSSAVKSHHTYADATADIGLKKKKARARKKTASSSTNSRNTSSSKKSSKSVTRKKNSNKNRKIVKVARHKSATGRQTTAKRKPMSSESESDSDAHVSKLTTSPDSRKTSSSKKSSKSVMKKTDKDTHEQDSTSESDSDTPLIEWVSGKGRRQKKHEEDSKGNENLPSYDSTSEDSDEHSDEETSFLHSVAKLIGWNRAQYKVEAPASMASVCQQYMIFVDRNDKTGYSYQLVKAVKQPKRDASSNLCVKYVFGIHKGRLQNMKFELDMYKAPPARIRQWAVLERCD